MNDNKSQSQHSQAYDAIIVLANLMDHLGQLNEESQARMDTAARAFLAKEAPYIITTGWAYRDDCDLPIALAMRDYAITHYAIPATVVICDTQARDTVGDAVFIKRNIVLSKEWKRLLVVTSDYHTKRTLEIFTFIYGPGYEIAVRGAPTTSGQTAEQEQQSLQAFHKTFDGVTTGDTNAILECLRQRHPFYNGTTYPAI